MEGLFAPHATNITTNRSISKAIESNLCGMVKFIVLSLKKMKIKV